MPLPHDLTEPLLSDEWVDAEALAADPTERVLTGAMETLTPVEARARRVLAGADPWRIESDGGAEWAMRQLAHYTRHVADVDGLADRYRAEVDAWRARAAGPAERRARFFAGRLEDYLRRVREAEPDPKRRPASLPLVSGTITSRTPTKPGVEVTDADQLKEWAWRRAGHQVVAGLRAMGLEPEQAARAVALVWAGIAADDLLKVDAEVRKQALNTLADVKGEPGERVVVVDGEAVPGVRAVEPHTTYKAKPGAAAESDPE